jgi:hypothetical protein
MKLVASGQMKMSSRKPLLLRHFNLSFNELLLARIFYSPIVAPNVKFGFVVCALHRYPSDARSTFEQMIETFVGRVSTPLWRSTDEAALILNEVRRGQIYAYQAKKNGNDDHRSVQRVCRLLTLLSPVHSTKQLQIVEHQLLEGHRQRLSRAFRSLFPDVPDELSATELLIHTVCCQVDASPLSSSLFACPLCNSPLSMSNADLLVSACSNKHQWPRCSLTLLPLTFDCAQTCSLCNRTITAIDVHGDIHRNFVKYKDAELSVLFSPICTYCL